MTVDGKVAQFSMVDKRPKPPEQPKPCVLCQWVRNVIVAKELKDWKLPDGTRIEVKSFSRCVPPVGLQFKASGHWAPLCAICSQFLNAWMAQQEQQSLQASRPATAKIILPTQEQVRSVGRILLP